MTTPLKLSKLISEDEIQKRIHEMGASLSDKFKKQSVTAVCVLKGSFIFYADLIRELESDVICEFFGVSSYQDSTLSSGEVKLTLDLSAPVEGKHVLLIEDIVDTGLTMKYIQANLSARKPKSLTSVALLHKPDAKKTDCKLDLVGFTIPNDFVVGYGLDYQGLYRNLPYVAQIQNFN